MWFSDIDEGLVIEAEAFGGEGLEGMFEFGDLFLEELILMGLDLLLGLELGLSFNELVLCGLLGLEGGMELGFEGFNLEL